MPIQNEDDKSPWEQYHIILLSHIAMYWIWSMLDPDERLLVTGVSPPIFGSQHCFRFRNRMQLNMDGVRLNTLYNKLPFLFKIYIARPWRPNDVNPQGSIRLTDLSLLECYQARNLRNYLKRENGTEIVRHHTSKNGR